MKTEYTAIALIRDGGKVLMIRRTKEPWSGLWSFPGGHVDEDESPQEAVLREVREETGIDIELETIKREDFTVLAQPFVVATYPVLEHRHVVFIFKAGVKKQENISGSTFGAGGGDKMG